MTAWPVVVVTVLTGVVTPPDVTVNFARPLWKQGEMKVMTVEVVSAVPSEFCRFTVTLVEPPADRVPEDIPRTPAAKLEPLPLPICTVVVPEVLPPLLLPLLRPLPQEAKAMARSSVTNPFMVVFMVVLMVVLAWPLIGRRRP